MTRLFFALALVAGLSACSALTEEQRRALVGSGIAVINAARALEVDLVDIDPADRDRIAEACTVARAGAAAGNPDAVAAAEWCKGLETLAAEG